MAPTQDRLVWLNREIDSYESIASALSADRLKAVREANRIAWRLRYLRIASWIRLPGANDDFWSFGLVLVASVAAAVLAFITAHLLLGSVQVAFLGSFVAATAIGTTIAIILRYPSDTVLPSALSAARVHQRESRLRREEIANRQADASNALQMLIRERIDLLASAQWKRESLLLRDWQAMRGNTWEDYLVEVFHALGAKAERIGGSGDQGVDIIVEIGQRRIAVQAKGYDAQLLVNNKAIQEAFAGMAHHRCCACAVITNTRFRRSARELAASTGCILIGVWEFRDFVMGKRQL